MSLKKHRVVVLGAGFGGLELTTILSEALGERLDLTLIDKNDSFIFGFSKLDIMFGREELGGVKHYYRDIAKTGVQFKQETITSIDPESRRVTTEGGTYDADILVVALGADYDCHGTPGISHCGHEYYSVQGACRVRELLPRIRKGHILVGVSSWPYKCPPAPSETVLMLHDYLSERGYRKDCEITLCMPMSSPIPPAPESSQALLDAFAERNIAFIGNKDVTRLEPGKKVAVLNDGVEIPFDLYLAIPPHCPPKVVQESGMVDDGWIPVAPQNFRTRFPGVYAVGDVTRCGVPKAGTLAEGAAKVAAGCILEELINGPAPDPFLGRTTCYIEWGSGRVGKVEIDFLSGPKPVGVFKGASTEYVKDKQEFASHRRHRWFDS